MATLKIIIENGNTLHEVIKHEVFTTIQIEPSITSQISLPLMKK